MRGRKPKHKAITIEVLDASDTGKDSPYRTMETLIRERLPELQEAKIGLAWRHGWKVNADGLLELTKTKKRSDLDRALNHFDFVILINYEVWPCLKDDERLRAMYHALLHCQICTTAGGEVKRDEGMRPVCRIRKHQVEAFSEEVACYGIKQTISEIARAALMDADRPLLAGGISDKCGTDPGESDEPDTEDGVPIETKIPCGKLKQTGFVLLLVQTDDQMWRGGFRARLGNYEGFSSCDDAQPVKTRSAAIDQVRLKFEEWLDGIELTGTADHKRSFAARRKEMKATVAAALEKEAEKRTRKKRR